MTAMLTTRDFKGCLSTIFAHNCGSLPYYVPDQIICSLISATFVGNCVARCPFNPPFLQAQILVTVNLFTKSAESLALVQRNPRTRRRRRSVKYLSLPATLPLFPFETSRDFLKGVTNTSHDRCITTLL